VDTPEQPHQHPAHTGHSWLDIGLAICAMFVSVITLFVAIEHGRTMQRMADANARMVEANSWPFVAFETHNERGDDQGRGDVRLVLRNQGIGPARIQTFELWYNGQPMSSPKQLFGTCCAITPAEREAWQTTVMGVGATAPTILRAGDHTDFLSMPAPEDRHKIKMELWRKFNVERDKISVRVCYCSVFDECWIGSGTTTQADRVQSCPAPKVPYQP